MLLKIKNKIDFHKKIKGVDPDNRYKHRDSDTVVVNQIKTKPGMEKDGQRNRCRETP